jgi:hypothetical protein
MSSASPAYGSLTALKMAERLRQIVARFAIALSAGDTPGFVSADNKLFRC